MPNLESLENRERERGARKNKKNGSGNRKELGKSRLENHEAK
jgi:hypothetical protein